MRLQAWVRWVITLAWASMIFNLSTAAFGSSLSAILLGEILRFLHFSVSPGAFATLHFFVRKSAHLTEYAIFGLLLYHCFLNSNRTEWRPSAAAQAVLAAGLYSLTDEFHQIFVPGRTASLIDCGIDTAGAAIGVLGILIWKHLFRPAPLAAEEVGETIPK